MTALCRRIALSLLASLALAATASAQVVTHPNVEYAVHDGESLLGDLYLPDSPGPHPAMVFIHGGAWRVGSKSGYGNTWGPFLAANGIAVFAIDYRLSLPTRTTWPEALLDCKAAVQWLRGSAAAFGIDPDRIGVGGDSAGGQLSSMIALTQDWPAFAGRYPGDAFAMESTRVKAVIPVYPVADMIAWWKYTLTSRTDKPLEQLFGGVPFDLPGSYLEASPIAYVRAGDESLGGLALENAGFEVPWLVVWGTKDTIVPEEEQGIVFVDALRRAGADVSIAPVPNAGHLWWSRAPLEGSGLAASPNAFVAPRVLSFLREHL